MVVVWMYINVGVGPILYAVMDDTRQKEAAY